MEQKKDIKLQQATGGDGVKAQLEEKAFADFKKPVKATDKAQLEGPADRVAKGAVAKENMLRPEPPMKK